jgi:hypothetical protein
MKKKNCSDCWFFAPYVYEIEKDDLGTWEQTGRVEEWKCRIKKSGLQSTNPEHAACQRFADKLTNWEKFGKR